MSEAMFSEYSESSDSSQSGMSFRIDTMSNSLSNRSQTAQQPRYYRAPVPMDQRSTDSYSEEISVGDVPEHDDQSVAPSYVDDCGRLLPQPNNYSKEQEVDFWKPIAIEKKYKDAYDFLQLIKKALMILALTIASCSIVLGLLYYSPLLRGPKGLCLFEASYPINEWVRSGKLSLQRMGDAIAILSTSEDSLKILENRKKIITTEIFFDNPSIQSGDVTVVAPDLLCSDNAQACYHFQDKRITKNMHPVDAPKRNFKFTKHSTKMPYPRGVKNRTIVGHCGSCSVFVSSDARQYDVIKTTESGLKTSTTIDLSELSEKAIILKFSMTWQNKPLLIIQDNSYLYIKHSRFPAQKIDLRRMVVSGVDLVQVTSELWQLTVMEPKGAGMTLHMPVVDDEGQVFVYTKRSVTTTIPAMVAIDFQRDHLPCKTRFRACEIQNDAMKCFERLDPNENPGCPEDDRECIPPDSV